MDILRIRGEWHLIRIHRCRWYRNGLCMEWASRECLGLVPNSLLINLPEFLYQCKPILATEGTDQCQ